LRRPPPDIESARGADPNHLPARYVPSTHRAHQELNLSCNIPLEDALRKTLEWLSMAN
jgi:nucleoside-diphosphate-sugar epimerase